MTVCPLVGNPFLNIACAEREPFGCFPESAFTVFNRTDSIALTIFSRRSREYGLISIPLLDCLTVLDRKPLYLGFLSQT